MNQPKPETPRTSGCAPVLPPRLGRSFGAAAAASSSLKRVPSFQDFETPTKKKKEGSSKSNVQSTSALGPPMLPRARPLVLKSVHHATAAAQRPPIQATDSDAAPLLLLLEGGEELPPRVPHVEYVDADDIYINMDRLAVPDDLDDNVQDGNPDTRPRLSFRPTKSSRPLFPQLA